MKKKKLLKQKALDLKLKQYKQVLKNDEDWDWSYILKVLKYKLERTRKCISANKIVKNAPLIARQIREVEHLLERVDKDRYFDEVSKRFRKKYGRLKMISTPIPGKTYSSVTFKFAKETPQNSKKIHKENRRLWIKADRQRKESFPNFWTQYRP